MSPQGRRGFPNAARSPGRTIDQRAATDVDNAVLSVTLGVYVNVRVPVELRVVVTGGQWQW